MNQRLYFIAMLPMVIPLGVWGQSEALPVGAEEVMADDLREHPWTLVPSFGWSFFNRGRESWQHESLELYHHLAEEQLLLDASAELFHRPPNGYDMVYGFGASWYPNNDLELHGRIKLTDDADFMPSERYGLGLQYRFHPRWELLVDVERLEFGSYAADWDDGITMRYTHGWVHDEVDYDYYSVAATLGDLPKDAELVVSLAYGSDPDLDFGAGGTTLSDAYVVGLMYKQPLNPDLTTFIGLEYVYRMRADNDRELYQKLTPTIGLSWKF